VAATQIACSEDMDENLKNAETLIRDAAKAGAQIILLQELFHSQYFCQEQDAKHCLKARPSDDNPMLDHMASLAKELDVVLPVSFFEKANNAYFNSLMVIDADGSKLGVYRKSHIPDGPGYQEKFYFSPGDTGFQVWQTKYAKIGVAICWDQWFPEAARSMALNGAEVIFYPTAIGSEPQNPTLDSREHWQRVMQGHAAANMVPVVASNRVGVEAFGQSSITFYGSSFITDETGAIVQQAGRTEREVILAEIDADKNQQTRASWGLFRDRRPDLYGSLNSLSGKQLINKPCNENLVEERATKKRKQC